ncbi:hypothetical protein Tco_1029687 [Tanacetum coccineum]|uniref:Secreted protein n=1 Tax=Tanacetum coccineum TaxID=301880 RepID=A0ABQ5G4D7_9ASTR
MFALFSLRRNKGTLAALSIVRAASTRSTVASLSDNAVLFRSFGAVRSVSSLFALLQSDALKSLIKKLRAFVRLYLPDDWLLSCGLSAHTCIGDFSDRRERRAFVRFLMFDAT